MPHWHAQFVFAPKSIRRDDDDARGTHNTNNNTHTHQYNTHTHTLITTIKKRPERPEMMRSGPESPSRVKSDHTFLAVKQHRTLAKLKI